MCGGVVMHQLGLAHLRSGSGTDCGHQFWWPSQTWSMVSSPPLPPTQSRLQPDWSSIIANTTRNYFGFGWPFKIHFFNMLAVITVYYFFIDNDFWYLDFVTHLIYFIYCFSALRNSVYKSWSCRGLVVLLGLPDKFRYCNDPRHDHCCKRYYAKMLFYTTSKE